MHGDVTCISLGESISLYSYSFFLGKPTAHCHNTQHGPLLPLWSDKAKDSACSLLTDPC